jgi:hypothetical protein
MVVPQVQQSASARRHLCPTVAIEEERQRLNRSTGNTTKFVRRLGVPLGIHAHEMAADAITGCAGGID